MTNFKQILKERAKVLAVEQVVKDLGQTLDCLVFKLGNERYGVQSLYIHKVVLLQDLTALPGMPPFFTGIVNIRGKIIPVLNLKKIFDIEQNENLPEQKIIVISVPHGMFALVTDEVIGLTTIPVTSIQESLPTLQGVRTEYLEGITNEKIVILNPEKIVSDKKLFSSLR